MRSDDFFRNRRKKLSERKREVRNTRPNSFLIVTEGKNTEPHYFDGIADYINSKYGSSYSIDVQKPIIKTQGRGRSPKKLVEETSKIVSRSRILYEHIWVVFDKDDFDDFDEAIELAESRGFKVAWSNQSFEYWLYLHFEYSDSALHRAEWCKKLDEIFRRKEIDKQGYNKNNKYIFDIVKNEGGLKRAIENVAKIEKTYDKGAKPSKCDPCTKVHHLILELKPYISELL